MSKVEEDLEILDMEEEKEEGIGKTSVKKLDAWYSKGEKKVERLMAK